MKQHLSLVYAENNSYVCAAAAHSSCCAARGSCVFWRRVQLIIYLTCTHTHQMNYTSANVARNRCQDGIMRSLGLRHCEGHVWFELRPPRPPGLGAITYWGAITYIEPDARVCYQRRSRRSIGAIAYDVRTQRMRANNRAGRKPCAQL